MRGITSLYSYEHAENFRLGASSSGVCAEGITVKQERRIFSGMRPTGRLHVGNYLGALQNWVGLQEGNQCIYSAVDVHALTTVTSSTETKAIRPNIHEMVLDWLAASSHHSAIAAVRSAHRRHGGEGALYIILKRR